MIDDIMIQKIIRNNYTVLLGFEVADGNMPLNDYMKKVSDGCGK